MKTWTTLCRPYYDNRPRQRWRSSINLIFFRGVSPQFRSFWSFDDKGGEIWVSLQAGLLYGRLFLLSYNSRSSDDFVGSSCKLKPNGALILLICFSACLFLIYANARMLNYISHHISSCISNSSLLYVKCVYELQDIGGDLHDSTLQVCIASKENTSPCTYLGGVLLYLAIKFLNISIYTSYVYPHWKLNLYCHQSPKRGRL